MRHTLVKKRHCSTNFLALLDCVLPVVAVVVARVSSQIFGTASGCTIDESTEHTLNEDHSLTSASIVRAVPRGVFSAEKCLNTWSDREPVRQ